MAKSATKLTASSKAIDPTLDALFASSAGPVQAPSKLRYAGPSTRTSRHAPTQIKDAGLDGESEPEGDDEVLSELSDELSYQDADEDEDEEGFQKQKELSSNDGEDNVDENGEDAVSVTHAEDQKKENAEARQSRRQGKRKRNDDNDNLEGNYFAGLIRQETGQPSEKRSKFAKQDAEGGDDSSDEAPVHETLTDNSEVSNLEKASRTVFLANISIEAMTSKSAKKTLVGHLSSALNTQETPSPKLESIRFRSVAFSTDSLPKRAAYITKSLMKETTKSANAYAVFSTSAAATQVVSKLNGTEILGRHIRVDSVAHPAATDHRRCVFVGNLGFIDDETVAVTNKDGEKTEKKRTKIPADAEEGLWQTFGKVGKVENVRVIRDAKTRVGKGFAYVQFYDGNDVEAALLLNGKKFPPMLPRILRVTRAKDPRKTALAQERSNIKAQLADRQASNTKYAPKMTPDQRAASGRAGKLLGRAGGFMLRKKVESNGINGGHTAPNVALEGRRASSKDGRPRDLKFGKGKKGQPGKSKKRGAARAASWRKKS